MRHETRTRSIGSVPMYTESGEKHIVQIEEKQIRVHTSPEGWSDWKISSRNLFTSESPVTFVSEGICKIALTGQLIYLKSRRPGFASS